MKINPEYELEVRKHLANGQREQAAEYLQTVLNISPENAVKLVEAVENELRTEQAVRQQAFDRLGNFFGGCGALVLKGISFMFGFFAFSMILGASVAYYFMNQYASEGNRINGTVIELTKDSNGMYAPKIEYTFDGEKNILTSQVYGSGSEYSIGQTVSIFVNPENPKDAIIDSFTERFMIPAIFGGFGLFFLVITIISIVVAKKIQKSL